MQQIPLEEARSVAGVGCDRARSCLSGNEACLCRVEQLLDDVILFVTPPPEMNCTHKMRYRDTHLCTSPVRREIYKRYRI